MIVNTAYPYMKKEDTPANPIIYSGSQINYPYTQNKVAIAARGINFDIGDGVYIEFSEIDATKFSKISITAENDNPRLVYISIKMIDAKGSETSATSLSFPKETKTTREWTIPESYRTKNMKVRLSTSNTRTILSTLGEMS